MFFRLGGVLTVLMGVAHFIQMRNGIYVPNHNEPGGNEMLELMKTFEIDTGFGIHRTMWELVSGFLLCWGLFVFVIGFLDLWVLRYERNNNQLLDRLSLTNLIGLVFVVAIGLGFFSYPVVIFAGLVALCFGISMVSPVTRI